MTFAFSLLFVLAGCLGAYGMADGYVFMILTLFFGSMGGMTGIGMVILIMITAGFSFLIHHLVKCMIKRRKLFQNMAAALIPHILIGYGIVWAGVFIYAA